MRRNTLLLLLLLLSTSTAYAFLEDLCLPRKKGDPVLSYCIQPNRPNQNPNRANVQQTLDFATIKPGRSMIHADSTFFIAQALGYRADVAYWIAAYNENADYGVYQPIDQCGVQASTSNSGANYISAAFNGFVRTNTKTDGPLDHYVVAYSPNKQGTDVHGAGGVQALYPFHYPQPGYPLHIDDTYQKTLANLRQWAMLPTSDPGLLCTVGLTASATTCVTGTISGTVPLIKASTKGIAINVPAGKKVLNFPSSGDDVVYYDQLESFLNDKSKTTGTLYLSRVPEPVPVQVARIGLYLHVLQDTSSHSTYCGDDGPAPPGGRDPGTYMYTDSDGNIKLSFGSSCASSPHLAGHVQETGTGDAPLPLRDYVALNNTVDELIAFGNEVALKHEGWIANPELLPPDVTGGKNAQGDGAMELKTALVGHIVQGTPYSRAEVYQSGVVTLPLQQSETLDRLHAMNKALADYGDRARQRSAHPDRFVPFQQMPGNSADPKATNVCWH